MARSKHGHHKGPGKGPGLPVTGEPIFKAAQTPRKQDAPAQPPRKEASVARRMASLEKKLGNLQGACLAMEEESSTTTERLAILEVCFCYLCWVIKVV